MRDHIEAYWPVYALSVALVALVALVAWNRSGPCEDFRSWPLKDVPARCVKELTQ